MDNEQCREKVCVVCSKKASRKLSDADVETARLHVDNQFIIGTSDYPCGVCLNCHIALNKKAKGQDAKLNINQKYKPFRYLHSSDAECKCPICEIAKSCGLKQFKKSSKRGRPRTCEQQAPTIKVCSQCFQQVYQGCRHQCSSTSCRRDKVYNVEKHLRPGFLKMGPRTICQHWALVNDLFLSRHRKRYCSQLTI